MTPNRRIFLNIIASYGRSLLSVACGLFSTRWVLMALGQTDMGLYSVVGGLTLFINFFNIQFAIAIARYFANSIGQASKAEDKEWAIEECRHWFNVSVFIHLVLPLVLMSIGYPLGAYAIRNEWLNIPMERVNDCLWVWRFTCFSCLIGMMNVPFYGMFTAKQYIAEVTIYNVAQTIVRTLFIYFMVTHPGDWLARYAFGMMLIMVVPAFLICIRAIRVFPECKFRYSYMWDWDRIRQIVSFVTWQVVGSVGYVCRTTGISILVNKILGPRVNAAMSIGVTVCGETAALTGALTNAFTPAIATKFGANEINQMREMAFRASKFGMLMTLIFAIPLSLEVDEVLRLWLKEPPPYASEICLFLLACVVIEKSTIGHLMAVNASGVIAKFQCWHGFALMTALPISFVCFYFAKSIWPIGVGLLFSICFCSLSEAMVARKVVGMSINRWIMEIIVPIIVSTMCGEAAGYVSRFIMAESFYRIPVTVFLSMTFFIPCVWRIVLSEKERQYCNTKLGLKLRPLAALPLFRVGRKV